MSITMDSGPHLFTGPTSSGLQIFKLVTLVTSSVSMASALVAFYWFMHMKRKFRHDLIMLLIQSDMFMSLWYMIFVVVQAKYGPVESTSVFCQVSGFMIAVGIGSTDMALLMIALHTALYFSSARGREGGLHPYRRAAFFAWLLVPSTLASLAFINRPAGFINTGYTCYLPMQPIWPRLALSWIPRAFILASITVIYCYVYYFVNVRLKRIGTSTLALQEEAHNTVFSASKHPASTVSDTLPIPILECHGLIPSASSSRNPLTFSTTHDQLPLYGRVGLPVMTPPSALSEPPAIENRTAWYDMFDHKHSTFDLQEERRVLSGDLVTSPAVAHMSSRRTLQLTDTSQQVVHGSLRTFRGLMTRSTTTGSRRISLPPLGTVSSNGDKTREKMIRLHLRLLFVYPLVYGLVWIAPLVNNIFTWGHPTNNAPVVLVAISVASLCGHGAVNALLFCTWEKPWRHRLSKRLQTSASSIYIDDRLGFASQGAPAADTTRDNEVLPELALHEGLTLAQASASAPALLGQHRLHTPRRERDWWDVEESYRSVDEDDDEQ